MPQRHWSHVAHSTHYAAYQLYQRTLSARGKLPQQRTSTPRWFDVCAAQRGTSHRTCKNKMRWGWLCRSYMTGSASLTCWWVLQLGGFELACGRASAGRSFCLTSVCHIAQADAVPFSFDPRRMLHPFKGQVMAGGRREGRAPKRLADEPAAVQHTRRCRQSRFKSRTGGIGGDACLCCQDSAFS
jgi:hypothetical protein